MGSNFGSLMLANGETTNAQEMAIVKQHAINNFIAASPDGSTSLEYSKHRGSWGYWGDGISSSDGNNLTNGQDGNIALPNINPGSGGKWFGVDNILSAIWNSAPMRQLVPDMISFGVNYGGGLIGGFKYNWSINLVTRGKDFGFHNSQTATLFVGANLDASFDISVSRYLGDVNDIRFSDYLGSGKSGTAGFLGSATIAFSHNGLNLPTWGTGSASFGLSIGGFVGTTNTLQGWSGGFLPALPNP